MSDDDRGKRPRHGASRRPRADRARTAAVRGAPQETAWEIPDLETLAVEDRARQELVAGTAGRLSDYAARYPRQAAALADLLRDLRLPLAVTRANHPPLAGPPGVDGDDEALRRAYDVGVAAALRQIGAARGSEAMGSVTPLAQALGEPLARVAETGAPYQAAATPGEPPDASLASDLDGGSMRDE